MESIKLHMQCDIGAFLYGKESQNKKGSGFGSSSHFCKKKRDRMDGVCLYAWMTSLKISDNIVEAACVA